MALGWRVVKEGDMKKVYGVAAAVVSCDDGDKPWVEGEGGCCEGWWEWARERERI